MVKTEAIVLHTLRYRDHSYIIHLFTREQGNISCLVKGSKHKAVLSPVLMQPLSLIDIVIDFRSNRTFQYIQESSPLVLLNNIPYHPIKNSIALFLSEVLYKTFRESYKETELFDFIKESIIFSYNYLLLISSVAFKNDFTIVAGTFIILSSAP